MTSPKHAKSTGKGRQYVHPKTGATFPSVTTILGQIGKAEALKWWAAGEVARYAVTNRDTWLQLDDQAAVDLLKREPLRSLSRAASRGTDVHAVAEHYANTGEISEMIERNGYIDALVKFFLEMAPMPVLNERTVFGDGYAGSFDMLCRMPALGDRLCILDFKTSKAIYPDTAAQLAAYARAEHYLDDRDEPVAMLQAECGVVVRFGDDGEYEVQQMDLDAGWLLFKAALDVWRAQQEQLVVGPVTRTDHQFDEARQMLVRRVQYLRDQHPDRFTSLQQNWISGLPRLTSDEPITRHQMVILDQRLTAEERQVGAPFNPWPIVIEQEQQTAPATPPKPPKPKPSDELHVSKEEIEVIRRALEASTEEVKRAVKETATEARKSGQSLNLTANASLRRALLGKVMIECYTLDPTREFMKTVLRHLDIQCTTLGETLASLDIEKISLIGETVRQVDDGSLELVYEPDTATFNINRKNR